MAKDVIDDRYKSLEGELQKIVRNQHSHTIGTDGRFSDHGQEMPHTRRGRGMAKDGYKSLRGTFVGNGKELPFAFLGRRTGSKRAIGRQSRCVAAKDQGMAKDQGIAKDQGWPWAKDQGIANFVFD